VKLRLGIAGCGAHALGRILPLVSAHPALELVAAWARNPATQQQLRERGTRGVSGEFAEFLATPMDVVYIATPTGCHHAHAKAVLESGRHAWVEKPMSCTLEETRELVELAERKRCMLAETFMFTWHAQAESILQLLAENSLGELRSATFTFCFPHLGPGNFRYDPALGGGAWLDHACYLVKALNLYLPGEWAWVGGSLERDGYPVDVRGMLQLRRQSDGMFAQLNWGFGHSYVNELQIVGASGRLLVESAFTKPTTRSAALLVEDSTGQRRRVELPPENPYESMLQGLAAQCRNSTLWPGMRSEILQHAVRFFGWYGLLTHTSATSITTGGKHAA
jgi:dTDP-3,4-didehydro-2,6-dideoxy-alpha-D-glucose 3-reductase